ncbi:hypothetical protein ACWD5Q_24620 [Streptomyces sp. NPDC002513]
MTETHHATDTPLAPAKLTPPPRIQAGATAQSPPVPSAHHGDGSTRTAIEGRAVTGTELRPARRAHHPYGHRRPAPGHSRLPIGELPHAARTFAARKGGCAARGTSGEPPARGGTHAGSPGPRRAHAHEHGIHHGIHHIFLR